VPARFIIRIHAEVARDASQVFILKYEGDNLEGFDVKQSYLSPGGWRSYRDGAVIEAAFEVQGRDSLEVQKQEWATKERLL
jgi:hypothetical protein